MFTRFTQTMMFNLTARCRTCFMSFRGGHALSSAELSQSSRRCSKASVHCHKRHGRCGRRLYAFSVYPGQIIAAWRYILKVWVSCHFLSCQKVRFWVVLLRQLDAYNADVYCQIHIGIQQRGALRSASRRRMTAHLLISPTFYHVCGRTPFVAPTFGFRLAGLRVQQHGTHSTKLFW